MDDKRGVIEVLVNTIKNNKIVKKGIPLYLTKIFCSKNEEAVLKEEIKELQEEMKKIKEAIGFLIPL